MIKSYNRTSKTSHAAPACLIVPLLALAASTGGCSDADRDMQHSTDKIELRQSAFRIRSDESSALNVASGWAAGVNKNTTITVDDPFRIRFEIEIGSDLKQVQSFSLEYKRNEEPWKPLTAEDFPYPIKEYAIDFTAGPESAADDRFDVITGDKAVFSRVQEDDGSFLRAESSGQPLLALARYETLWEAVEYGVVMRLSAGNTAGIVFGYEDAGNYYRLDATADNTINVVKVSDGNESVLSAQDVKLKADQWIEVKIVRNGNEIEVEYEWDDFIEGIAFSVEVGGVIPESRMGIYLAPGNVSDFAGFEVEGVTHSPEVSIISSSVFSYGDPTEDILDGSMLPFAGGYGISYGEQTPEWTIGRGHSEWEFPIVVRYFSDGAKRNLSGDTFEFRLVDQAGNSLASDANPVVTAQVPDGHLGGTFVETPNRVGPWEASNGDLYFLMEPSETDNMMMIVKSEDGGNSWSEMDGGNRPATGDLEGVAQVMAGDQIHTLHQTSDHVFQHVFRTSDHPENPDTWALTDQQLASPVEPPTQIADLAVRSNKSVVAVYGSLEKVLYKIQSSQGVWGKEIAVDKDDDSRNFSGPVVALGKEDVVHFAYTGSDGTAWYRQILPDGGMTQRQKITSGMGTTVDASGGILPLVYLADSDTVSIIYRLNNGELWERIANSAGVLSEPSQVIARKVVTNAADSEQAGADAVGYGSSVQVLFIEDGTGRIYHTYREGDGSWHEPKLAIAGVNALWVRGQVIKENEMGATYGYVYDAGSHGGSGMNKYAEIQLNNPEQ